MSMSTEQAEKMVDEKMAREAAASKAAEQPTEVKEPSTTGAEEAPKQEEPKQEQPKAEEQKDDKPKVEEPKEDKPKDDKPAEDKQKEENPSEDKQKRLPPSKKYTRDERIAHSFAVEKRKRQEAQAKVKELEAELAKVKGLKPEDFNNDVEAYTSYRLDAQHKLDEIERQKRFIEQSEAEENAKETKRKVSLCFPDENDRAEYEELISTRGREFYEALKEHDPYGVVLDYLNGVEKYPIVLRELMSNNKSLAYVFRDKDPYELRHNLHVFTKDLLAGKQAVPEEKKEDVKQPEQEQPQPKPKIPVIGKQVTAQAKPTEPVHDRAYWNEYLRKHPNG